jgi:putative CocE/NonD family hydrolase
VLFRGAGILACRFPVREKEKAAGKDACPTGDPFMKRSLVLICAACALPFVASGQVVVQHDVMVPMRDGVHLATDIHLPAKEGKFPAILWRTPYNKVTQGQGAQRYTRYGYGVVTQDVRGRFASEGHWRMLVDDPNDGYDTVEWIAQQPWSDGQVGMAGTSYVGMTQHAAAEMKPPHLKVLVPAYGGANVGMFGMRHQGAFELRFFNWIFGMEAKDSPAALADPGLKAVLTDVSDHVKDYILHLPLRPGTTPMKLAPDYESWIVEAMSHGDNDAWWKRKGLNVIDHLDDYPDIPVYHISGWYDSWALQVANLTYARMAAVKHNQKLLMGPWTHGNERRSLSGDVEFGPEAVLDAEAFHVRWFDRWMKGVQNGVDKEPPVRLFIMGGGADGSGVAVKSKEGHLFHGGHWRDESQWPPAGMTKTPYYLAPNGALATTAPKTAGKLQFSFDPAHPVPTMGGGISSFTGVSEPGGYDQRCSPRFWGCTDTLPLSSRNDILVFQTPALERDMEVTGPIAAKLYVSSSAPDTDFTAKLIDVYPPSQDYPAGYDLNITDGIVRARYRKSLEHAEMLRPGEVATVEIELYPTANIFKKGHRIRLDVSSSNFPRFDLNPNTGEPLNNNRRVAVAVNTVFLGGVQASEVVLPVMGH